jgi:hypothetical protein
MSRIEPAARFLDAVSGAEGLGRSMNSRLGRVSGGFPTYDATLLVNHEWILKY